MPNVGLQQLPMDDLRHPRYLGRAMKFGKEIAMWERPYLPNWAMAEARLIMSTATANLAQAVAAWMRELGVGNAVAQGIEAACMQLDQFDLADGTMDALQKMCKKIEDCNVRLGAEAAQMAGVEAVLVALHKLAHNARRRHAECQGAAEICAVQVTEAIEQCISVITQGQ